MGDPRTPETFAGGSERRGAGPRPIALALTLLLLLGLAARVAADSPAQGHASVVAQGVVTLPEGQAVWRVSTLPAPPASTAAFSPRPLGFVLADRDPILITDEATGDQTRLERGEAILVRDGQRQRRASLGDAATTYAALELVAADRAADLGSGRLVYASDPFPAPDGPRDLDLVRDVVQPGETSQLADPGAPFLLSVTEGAVEARTGMGPPPLALRAGEARLLAGNLAVRATGNEAASFVVAVIGPRVELASPPPTPGPAPPTAASGAGSVSFSAYLCPPGAGYDNFQITIDLCRPATDGFDVALTAPGGSRVLTRGDAALDPSSGLFTWRDVPLGAGYGFAATAFPSGYDAYSVTGDATATGGGAVAFDLSAASPDEQLSLYFLAPGPLGSVTVRVWACPPGMQLATLDASACAPLGGGFDLSLVHKYGGAMGGATLGLDRAAATPPGTFAWSGLVVAGYQLRATPPAGYDAAIVAGAPGDPLSGDFGVWPRVGIDQGAKDALVDLYFFQPSATGATGRVLSTQYSEPLSGAVAGRLRGLCTQQPERCDGRSEY